MKTGVKKFFDCLLECLSEDNTCTIVIYNSPADTCILSWTFETNGSPAYPTYRGEFINFKLYSVVFFSVCLIGKLIIPATMFITPYKHNLFFCLFYMHP